MFNLWENFNGKDNENTEQRAKKHSARWERRRFQIDNGNVHRDERDEENKTMHIYIFF